MGRGSSQLIQGARKRKLLIKGPPLPIQSSKKIGLIYLSVPAESDPNPQTGIYISSDDFFKRLTRAYNDYLSHVSSL